MWIMECQVKEGEVGQAQVIWREWRGGVVRRHDGLAGARRDAAMGRTHTKTRQAAHTWM